MKGSVIALYAAPAYSKLRNKNRKETSLFQKLHAEGRTIIFVTHNPEIAQYSSRNIVLRDGKIREDVFNSNIRNAAEALAALPAPED
jgi:ABC-type lipoprotein export system ATPase subunit